MAIYCPVLKDLNENEIRRYAGLQSVAEFHPDMITKASREALIYAEPKASWQIYDYASCQNSIMAMEPILLYGASIIKHLHQATQIAVIAVTIGDLLVKQVEEEFHGGEYTQAMLLDAAGTTAVERAADLAQLYIEQQFRRQGLQGTTRFSPGYGDWDIRIQSEILRLAEGEKIGMRLTSSFMLVPRKSITAVIGFYHGIEGEKKKADCANCGQLNCRARRK